MAAQSLRRPESSGWRAGLFNACLTASQPSQARKIKRINSREEKCMHRDHYHRPAAIVGAILLAGVLSLPSPVLAQLGGLPALALAWADCKRQYGYRTSNGCSSSPSRISWNGDHNITRQYRNLWNKCGKRRGTGNRKLAVSARCRYTKRRHLQLLKPSRLGSVTRKPGNDGCWNRHYRRLGRIPGLPGIGGGGHRQFLHF